MSAGTMYHSRAVLALVAVTFVGACSDAPTSPNGARAGNLTVSRAAQLELAAAAQGRHARGVEDEILRMENAVPGLGGMFVDGTGTVTLYVPRGADRAAIRRVIAQLAPTVAVARPLRDQLADTQHLKLIDGDFPFSQIVAWQSALIAKPLAGTGIYSVDADEASNRVHIMVAAAGDLASAQQTATAAGIPVGAVQIEVGSAPRALSSLRGTWTPPGGGVQISNSAGTRCTMGFNVTSGDQTQGFLTAAHCAPGVAGAGGTGDMYQPIVGSSYDRGWIRLNPLFNDGDPANCMGFTSCTRADVMYVQYYSASNGVKHVPYTDLTGLNNAGGSITVTGWWNNIAAAAVYPMVGQSADKMGRTTGWTRGTVVSTCAPVTVDGSYVVTCADKVTNGRVGTGDSGSPVFMPPAPGQVTNPLYPIGILFGGENLTQYDSADGTYYCNGSCVFYYSEWNQMEAHLGMSMMPQS